jgi:hypothetical protein
MNLNARRNSDKYGSRKVSAASDVRVKNITGRVINGSGSVKAVVLELPFGVEPLWKAVNFLIATGLRRCIS